MYLRWRSAGLSRREEAGLIDADKRQVTDDVPDDFSVRVETLVGGLLVTLTHAVGPVETLPPDNPTTIDLSSTSIAILTTEEPQATSSDPLPDLEAPIPSSEALPVPPPAVGEETTTTLTTSIVPEDRINTSAAIPIATGDLQANSEGDADRLPAIGITIGALAGAGLVIGAGVMLYRYKHRNDVKLKMKEKRQFQEI